MGGRMLTWVLLAVLVLCGCYTRTLAPDTEFQIKGPRAQIKRGF